MLVGLPVSERCRNLMLNIHKSEQFRLKKYIGFQTIFAAFAAQMGDRNLFERLAKDSKRIWELDQVKLLARAISSMCALDESALFDHLMDGSLHDNLLYVELMLSEYLRETASTLPEVNRKLSKCLIEAKLTMSVQRITPLRHVSPSAIDGYLQFQQEELGFSSKDIAAKLKLFDWCQESFLNDYNPEKTRTVLGFLKSGFDDLCTQSGPCRHYSPDGAFDTIDGIREDSVNAREIEFRLINDGPGSLRPELAFWAEQFDVMLAVDDRFVMKIMRGGGLRKFMERTGNPEKDFLLDQELSLLREILSDKYLLHAPDKRSTIKLLEKHAIDVEKSAEKEKNEHLAAKLEPPKQLRERPPAPPGNAVWSPTLNRWISL